MSRQNRRRPRKQRFPRHRDRRSLIQTVTDSDGVEEVTDCLDGSSSPIESSNIPDSHDGQAQMDRNEQERGRRREMAILYEMTRTCINHDDIERHLVGKPKSPSKLSYPQILQIACENAEEAVHDMMVLESLVAQCEALELECRRRGIAYAEGPNRDALIQRHRATAHVVQETLAKDKE